ERELETVLPLAPRLIGINNRNLKTFSVDRATTRILGERIPSGVVRVSESGYFRRAELDELPEVDAFLVGESLVTAPDPRAALQALREG
ncbi:MAG: indole-3-glycerol-phosphate synthase TrpC, partial [Candidatus Eremiobacterota bacterium]